MRCAEGLLLALALVLPLAGCGGGNSTETRCVGVNCNGITPGQAGPEEAELLALATPPQPPQAVSASEAARKLDALLAHRR